MTVYCKLNKNITKIQINNGNIKKFIQNGSTILEIFDKQNSITVLIINNNRLLSKSIINSSNIFYLNIKNNYLNGLNFFKNDHLNILQYLDISNNPIKSIQYSLLANSMYLMYLDITNTNFIKLDKNIENLFKELKILKLDNNLINVIDTHIIKNKENMNIHSIYIFGKHFYLNKKIIYFIKNLINTTYFYGENEKILCFCKKIKRDVVCQPKIKSFPKCLLLLQNNIIKLFLWSFTIFGIFLNTITIKFLFKYNIQLINLYFAYICIINLIITMFFTYLIIIDKYFDKNYLENEIYWLNSKLCNFSKYLYNFLMFYWNFLYLHISIKKYKKCVNNFRYFNIFFLKDKYFLILTFIISIIFGFFPYLYMFSNNQYSYLCIIYNFELVGLHSFYNCILIFIISVNLIISIKIYLIDKKYRMIKNKDYYEHYLHIIIYFQIITLLFLLILFFSGKYVCLFVCLFLYLLLFFHLVLISLFSNTRTEFYYLLNIIFIGLIHSIISPFIISILKIMDNRAYNKRLNFEKRFSNFFYKQIFFLNIFLKKESFY